MRELVRIAQMKFPDIRRAARDFQAGRERTRSAAVAPLHAPVTELQLNSHAVDAGLMEDVPDLLMEHFDSAERTVEIGGDTRVQRGHVATLRQLPQVSVVDAQDPGKAAHFVHCGEGESRSNLSMI